MTVGLLSGTSRRDRVLGEHSWRLILWRSIEGGHDFGKAVASDLSIFNC